MLDRMKNIMDKAGLNAKQLTTELGISNSSFSDWKKGKGSPSVSVLKKFAEYFDESLDYIILGKKNSSNMLELSNRTEKELLEKFNQLTPECQTKALGYIDGMIAATSVTNDSEKRLSV